MLLSFFVDYLYHHLFLTFNPALLDFQLNRICVCLIFDPLHDMRSFTEFVEFSHQVHFFGVGDPFPVDESVGCGDGESEIFVAIVETSLERVVFPEGVAVLVNGIGHFCEKLRINGNVHLLNWGCRGWQGKI